MSDLFQNCLETVNYVNDSIESFIVDNSESVVPLGPLYSSMDAKTAELNLQLFRLQKKFKRPSSSDIDRAHRSVQAMFDYDANGLVDFDIKQVDDDFIKLQLNVARFELQKMLKSFRKKFDYSNFDLPSGETYVTSHGKVAAFFKLSDIRQWVCSPSCFDLFAKICYNSPGLKYAAKQHIKAAGLKHHRFLTKINAFEMFKFKLKQIITFVDVSRITTVPKDKDTDRVILCEPMCNMIVQRCIAKNLVKSIDHHFDVDLYDSQLVHQALLQLDDTSTIDLSNASNSNWMSVVRFFLRDTSVLPLLEAARITTVEYNGSYHHLNMISPMGNGFTFEVMTLILLNLSRTFDSFAHVFGDDIIVHNDSAEHVIKTLDYLGYKINESKTFIKSQFRESCGGFFFERHLLSFDIKWSENIAEAISNVNKIGLMARSGNKPMAALHKKLLKAIPLSLLGHGHYKVPYHIDPYYKYHMQKNNPVILLGVTSIQEYVVCSRHYYENRLKDEKVKSPLNDNFGTPTRIMRYRSAAISFSKKKRHWYPIDDVRGVLAYHYLYTGLGLPKLREGSVNFVRVT